MMNCKTVLLLFVSIVILLNPVYAQSREYVNVPGIFHVQSRFSDGQETIDQVSALAQKEGIKIIGIHVPEQFGI